MGGFLTIDKHVSNLEDVLELSPRVLSQTKFESHLPSEVTHHVKVWKFFEEDSKSKAVNVVPVQLSAVGAATTVLQTDCYLMLLVRTTNSSSTDAIPEPFYRLLESLTNAMTPRGLRTSVAESTRYNEASSMSYHLYVLNGRQSPAHVQHQCFAKSFEFERLLNSCEQLLPIMFGGGVIRNKKLQKGSLIQVGRDDESLRTFQDLLEAVDVLSLVSSKRSQPAIKNLLALPPKPLKHVKAPVASQGGPSHVASSQGVPSLAIPALKRPKQQKPQIPALNAVAPEPIPASNPTPPMKLKTPLLNLSLKPFEQTKYEEIEEEANNGKINFDIRATARHQLKMEYFESECTEILEGLYVSGEKVAKDYEMLKKHGITHVVNCAADYCENWFEDMGVNYLAFFLKDSQTESIECLFYRVIEFIESALKNKKKVLVHCIQGISRSVTMAIAYVMFVYEYDYKKAEAFVKQKRGVASPNNGFMVELIQFHKRLYESFDSLPQPRIYLVSSHCKETPQMITARLLKHPLYDKRKNIGLDCRGMYIIHLPDEILLWVGSRCEDLRLDCYWKYAQDYIKKLQKFEKAPKVVRVVSQGSEGLDFFKQLWGLDCIPELFEHPDYDNLFVPIVEGNQSLKPGANRKLFNNDADEQLKVKCKLFVYPDLSRALGVFESDDLSDLSVIMRDNQEELEVFVWREHDSQVTEEQQKEFIDRLVQKHYSHIDTHKITVFKEEEGRESSQFLECMH